MEPSHELHLNRSVRASTPLLEQFRAVRAQTEALCRPLSVEDCLLQSMPDASPPKWHLAHTTWFFEEFLLSAAEPHYERVHPSYAFLFNSYYEAVGPRHARPKRGLLSRPSLDEVWAYRREVDRRMERWLSDDEWLNENSELVALGLNHEQQHQELLLTDVKHGLAENALRPSYANAEVCAAAGLTASSAARSESRLSPRAPLAPLEFLAHPGGEVRIGQASRGDGGFAFDNEGPQHAVLLTPFALGHRLVTNAEYLRFVEDGGYCRSELWLSDGWARAQSAGWQAPLYWEKEGDEWFEFSLFGRRPLVLDAPVHHLSYYEADAYAEYAGARLPKEAEWEAFAQQVPLAGNLLDQANLRPLPSAPGAASAGGENRAELPLQLFGDVWEWTASPYCPYPGYRPAAGALGEYNGKFMVNQMVLRGGSCVTPASHIRATYRNFFYPDARWQFSGIRLARDLP